MRNLFLFVFLLSSYNYSLANITWLEVDFPPAYFVKGEMKGKGFSQAGLDKLIKDTPEEKHSKIIVNVNRLLNSMKDPKKVQCAPQLAVTVNQFPNTIYSTVAIAVPPAGIAVRKEDLNKFVKNGKVSFKTVIENTKLKLGSISKGQFGDQIDPIVEKHKGKDHLYFRNDTTNQLGNYKMLTSKRLDYVVDYPFSFSEAMGKLSKKEKESLVFLPVVEEMKPKNLRSICGDNPASRAFLEKINKIYKTKEYKEVVIASLLEFIPESLHESYKKTNLESIGK